MTVGHAFAILFAAAGLLTAMAAAFYWWKSSRVPIRSTTASISDVPELYIMSGHVAFNESSRLNSKAAVLTGIAAVLSATSSVLGVL